MAKKQKSPKGKHFVSYVENSEPKLRFFTKKTDVQKFVDSFTKKNPEPTDGYWVDFVCYDVGSFVAIDPLVERQFA
jgi:hypothetical protein